MSREYHVSYELERKRREALRLERVARQVEELLGRYRKAFEEMVRKGFEANIPDEMVRLEGQLDEAREQLIAGRADAALGICRSVGSYIWGYEELNSFAVARFERAERLRSEKAAALRRTEQSRIVARYYELAGKVDDPILAGLAAPKLETLRERAESGAINDIQQLEEAFTAVLEGMEPEAGKLRAEQKERLRRAELRGRIADAERSVAEAQQGASDSIPDFSSRIEKVKSALAGGAPIDQSLEGEIASIADEADEAAFSEEVRREAVRAIYSQLVAQEFTVEPPQLVKRDGKSYVHIVATRPSGRRAVCSIGSDSTIQYCFDQYEGMTCLKDIEQFNVALESVYSVKLSDERVLWSNPDRLGRETGMTQSDEWRYL